MRFPAEVHRARHGCLPRHGRTVLVCFESEAGSSTAKADGGAPRGFDAYLEQHGCTATAAASLITGHAFNGGLRHDCDAGIRSEKVCVN